MRAKKTPCFTPQRDCIRRSFFFHRKGAELREVECASKPKRRSSKAYNDEWKTLSAVYPHCIPLVNENAPTDRLLQSINIPMNYSPSLSSESCKLFLFFNSKSFLLYWREYETSKQFVVTDGSSVIPFLFAASSNSLEVYYERLNLAMQLHVCYKIQTVHSAETLLERVNTCQQYEKICDFVTILKPEVANSLKNHRTFVFERYCENQQEFIQLIQSLYKFVQHSHLYCDHSWKDEPVDLRNVITTLRPYQIDAVKWMLYRESRLIKFDTLKLFELMYTSVELPDSVKTLYFNNQCGFFVDKIPQIKPPSLGGILADEMGLGKTLEVISLVLTHPWSDWDHLGGRLYTLDGHVLEASDETVTSAAGSNRILCCCGGEAAETESCDLVPCSRCHGPMQHAACVQYQNAEEFMLKLPNKHGYICPECWSQIRIDSKATLIVTPDHIWQQWKEEFQSHVAQGCIKVLVYAGMEAPVTEVEVGVGCVPVKQSQRTSRGQSNIVNPFSSRTLVSAHGGNKDDSDMLLLPGFVQPGQLASADVVLTAFSVVQRELGWAEVTAERRAGLGQRPQLRLAQRYLCRPSPLTCVRWWRLCLDEAQMVERVTSKTARMLFQIEAVHRWCITGTPAEKSIDDLFGLFVFLRYEPFSIPLYWNCLLYQPFLSDTIDSRSDDEAPTTDHDNSAPSSIAVSASPNNAVKTVQHSAVGQTLLAKVLAQMLWRNTKELAGDQLSLPPISEEIHWITFTAVERYIHDRVLAQSSGALNRLLGQFSPDRPLANLSGDVHWRLVYMVTRLRQVCTHASLVVASGGGGEAADSRSLRRHHSSSNRLRRSADQLTVGAGYDEDGDDLIPRYQTSGGGGGGDCGEPSVSAARSLRHLGTGCFTMTEVLRKVVDETRRECEGLLRSWIFNKNGSASCYIIKQQHTDAADCYRDVLRVAASLESRHGILADCSQHLHVMTNLHWLIQAHHVPLLEDDCNGDARSVLRQQLNTLSRAGYHPVDGGDVNGALDPRVDRDLVAKAERLRLSYIQKHSHLLAKVHESLDPIVLDLNADLGSPVEAGTAPDKCSNSELVWLDWLAEAIDWLATRGVDGASLAGMLMASFQGRPLGNRCHYRTTLLQPSDIGSNSFKARLLYELSDVFKTRRQLHQAMQPLTATWKSFQTGNGVDRDILEAFYACCARADQPETEAALDKTLVGARKKQNKKRASELSAGDRVKSGQRKCAYCTAVKALRCYQCAVNHEKPTRASLKNSWLDHSAFSASPVDSLGELEDKRSTEVEQVLTASGVMLGNPMVVGLSIVCHQLVRCLGCHEGDKGVPLTLWRQRARRLDQLIRQMGKEVLLMSRTQSLTREWWNIHDDTEQFVVRLQATCPTDNAFIHLEEVDVQLQSYIVEAQVTWPQLQSRLAHFNFLRNAYMATATGAARDSPQHQLECPTCLQLHSPSNPTFALLPGCWHTLCLPCHDQIASSAQVAQRRCPVCRTPLSTMSAGRNAHRRRPLTLIHYAGEEKDSRSASVQSGQEPDSDELPVVGDHSSKVQAVIRCLKQIKRDDPDAKAIVFSSWISVLITLAGALDQNNLVYTTFLRARDACQPGRLTGFQFRGSSTWILLMPIQLGANGLNLTSANHVLLVDPVLSHGREAQAIARMHRIGQSRSSVVHRFLVRDSIEAALHAAHCRSGLSTAGCCMVGGGARRTSSTTLGVAGPGEDRAHLMQMTVGELADLLRMETHEIHVTEKAAGV